MPSVPWLLTEEKSNHQSYQARNLGNYKSMTTLARHTDWYNCGSNIVGVTNYFMIVFKAHPTRWNPYLHHYWVKMDMILSQFLMAYQYTHRYLHLSTLREAWAVSCLCVDFFAVSGEWHRDLQLIKVQRTRNWRLLSPIQNLYNVSSSQGWGWLWKRGLKGIKSQRKKKNI